MIYRIAFWIGSAVENDEAACAQFHERQLSAELAWEAYGVPVPPVPRMARFVDAVLDRFPDLDGPRSPWKYGDVAGDAMGEVFLPVLPGPNGEVLAELALLAAEHEVQAFDLAAHRRLRAEDVTCAFGVPLMRSTADSRDRWDGPVCAGPERARHRLGLAPYEQFLGEDLRDDMWDDMWDDDQDEEDPYAAEGIGQPAAIGERRTVASR